MKSRTNFFNCWKCLSLNPARYNDMFQPQFQQLAVLIELLSTGVIFFFGFKFFAKGIDGHLSLVNIHLILWTGIIVGSFFALSIFNHFIPIDIDEKSNSMVFVAIATGTMAGSSLIRSGQPPAAPSSSSKKRPKRQQLFGGEKNPESYSIAKLQMSAWNGVAMIFFLIQVFSMLAGPPPPPSPHFPDLKDTLTYIIGISNGIYLANKTGDKPGATPASDSGLMKVTNPVTVPERGFAPGGNRPKLSVHQIKSGNNLRLTNGIMQEIDHDGNVVTDFGTISARSGGGAMFPGILTQLHGRFPDMGSGWITYSNWDNTTGSPISLFSTTWKVPPPPVSQVDQTIFVFSGLYNLDGWILQPVLAWGKSAVGGENNWWVASWYVDNWGDAHISSIVKVNPNDTLVGVMTGEKQADGTFNYNCYFSVNGKKNQDTNLTIQGVQELQSACETLECYGIEQANQYPDATFTTMDTINIQTGMSNPVYPTIKWNSNNPVTDNGQKTMLVRNVSNGGRVDLYYKST